MYSIFPSDRLLGPRELHGATSPASYLTMQKSSIHAKMRSFSALNWREPFVSPYVAALKVSDSCWQLVCECGNCPSYDPEWALAACFTCGAVYRQPPPEDWREIQRILTLRPRLNNRHMLPGQTLADLVAENLEHGDPV